MLPLCDDNAAARSWFTSTTCRQRPGRLHDARRPARSLLPPTPPDDDDEDDMLSALLQKAKAKAPPSNYDEMEPSPFESPPFGQALGDATNRGGGGGGGGGGGVAVGKPPQQPAATAAAAEEIDALYLARTPDQLREFTLAELKGLLKVSA